MSEKWFLLVFPRPNEVFVIVDKRKRVERGRIWHHPLQRIQRVPTVQMEVLIDTNKVLTKDPGSGENKVGPMVHLVGIAQVKIGDSDKEILQAVERFLPTGEGDIIGSIKDRALDIIQAYQTDIAGTMTPEDIVTQKEVFAKALLELATPFFTEMGLTLRYSVKVIEDARKEAESDADHTYLKDLAAKRAHKAQEEAELARVAKEEAVNAREEEKEELLATWRAITAEARGDEEIVRQKKADEVAGIKVGIATKEAQAVVAEMEETFKTQEAHKSLVLTLKELEIVAEALKVAPEYLRSLKTIIIAGSSEGGNNQINPLNTAMYISMIKEILEGLKEKDATGDAGSNPERQAKDVRDGSPTATSTPRREPSSPVQLSQEQTDRIKAVFGEYSQAQDEGNQVQKDE